LAVTLLAEPSLLGHPHASDPPGCPVPERADRFLEIVNGTYQALYTVDQRAQWDAATDVTAAHDAAAEASANALAAFDGDPAVIREARALLALRSELDTLTARQLERVILHAAEGPMADPDLVRARVEAETRQASTLNGFVFTLGGEPITANEIDDRLRDLVDLGERRAVWEASKETGPALKPGLVRLQGLRNGVARELGYPNYFDLQVAFHDMTGDEMLRMNEEFLRVLEPLYLQLHTWAKHELARRYGQPVPKRIPVHWIPDRWAQDWSMMTASTSLDSAFARREPEWIVRAAEAFYSGMGMGSLPEPFWERSDLYPVRPEEGRKKNTHAWCNHIDLESDVRSLMSVEPNEVWFGTAHHELGHAFYALACSRPGVPPLLRDGASPAFDEAMAGLGQMASRSTEYLESLGLIPEGSDRADGIAPLLSLALADVPFLFFASGTMTHWEADLYAREMPPEEWNARWWRHVEKYQGVEAPEPRGEEFCDAATKTHISDAPAFYYSYAVATVLCYQLNDYIARNILHTDPRRANYAGNKEVGAFLTGIMRRGATRDWRTILRDATGEDLSTRAMVEYFRPLQEWLEKENAGREVGWE
jgi:peptidyl-dipeptidase A